MNETTKEPASLGLVEGALGEPAYREDGLLIYRGDCIDLMSRLPAQLVNLTVTSPPYNIGKEYEQVRDLDEYIAWCERWIHAVHRLTTSAGAFWLNLGYVSIDNQAKAVPLPYLLWQKVPFFLLQEVVWNYGAGVACKRMFSPRNEKFLWYVKDKERYTFNLDHVRDPNVKYPNSKKNGRIRCNPNGKNPTDVWQIPKVTSGENRSSKERTPHPAQFPVAVIERIILACSNPGDLVLDPFMGSGTVAQVALATGRRVVGFEIEERYIGICRSRIQSHLEKCRAEAAQGLLGFTGDIRRPVLPLRRQDQVELVAL
jgi:adenine-specific DNA-methyltransferase